MTQHHVAPLSLALALAALGAAGCAGIDPAGPPGGRAALSSASGSPESPVLIGPDAEFARIARGAPGFGGMFYDAGGRLNVYMTAATRRSPAATQAVVGKVSESPQAQGRPVPAGQDVVVLEGARDYVELTVLHQRMFPVLAEAGVVFTDIDDTRNRLVVGVRAGTSGAQIGAALERLGVPASAVDVEVTPAIVPLSGHVFIYGIMDALREDFDGPECRWTGPDGTVRCPRSRAFVTH